MYYSLLQYGVSLAHSTEWPSLLGKLEFSLAVIIIPNTNRRRSRRDLIITAVSNNKM